MSEVCGIILAAGEGKRMKSNLPKVLSRVLDKPMLKWVIDAARGAGIEALCVVDGFFAGGSGALSRHPSGSL